MAVTTEEIKELRDMTGLSVMDCKKALEETGGDKEKALVVLRKKSGAAAAKKADRTLGAGVVQAYVHSSKDVGAMVVLSCETDFVAKNEDFVKLAYDIAMHVAATSPRFLSRDDVKDEDIAAAKSVFEEEVQDKPADKQEMILKGKLDSYLKESVLLEQEFIKDPSLTIQALVEQATQKFGERVELTTYAQLSARS